ncbi:hypothetical protein QUF72_10430 [Desulfobacterales bacterium HSG2]|nr:hypothetical protein [Desulfobacterales bacterium HSG2]
MTGEPNLPAESEVCPLQPDISGSAESRRRPADRSGGHKCKLNLFILLLLFIRIKIKIKIKSKSKSKSKIKIKIKIKP